MRKFNIDLLRKYDVSGPRYTSYPTAPHFSEDFDADDYIEEIEKNDAPDGADLSLYIHLPFCKSRCLYCACNSIISRNKKIIDSYLDYLFKEIGIVSNLLDKKRQVVQIHLGGGTPNYLGADKLSLLIERLKNSFNVNKDAEISVELDPRLLDAEFLSSLNDTGFNRLSFGVQDLNAKVQQTVARINPKQMIEELIAEARKLEFSSVNFDLIYGLPYQTRESFSETVEEVSRISPDRIAVYNFAYMPWIKEHQKTLPEEAIPPASEKIEILGAAIEDFVENGYEYIGMDHFAKPEDELAKALNNGSLHRNFQGYTTKADTETLAFGATGISQLKNSYAQNFKTLDEYYKALDKGRPPIAKGLTLSDDDLIRRRVVNRIMCGAFIDKKEFAEEFNVNFDDYFKREIPRLKDFEREGLIKTSGDEIKVDYSGRLVIRNIAMIFDAYLKEDLKKRKKMYSKTL